MKPESMPTHRIALVLLFLAGWLGTGGTLAFPGYDINVIAARAIWWGGRLRMDSGMELRRG